MTTITINGKEFKVRPLTRGEIKSLKDCGYTYNSCVPTIEKANDALDKAFEIQFSKDEVTFLDDCTNKQGIKLWNEILKETYGAKEEEKNSDSTSSGT